MMSQTADAAAPAPASALDDDFDDLRAEVQRLRLEQATDQRTIQDLSAAVAARDEFIAMVATSCVTRWEPSSSARAT